MKTDFIKKGLASFTLFTLAVMTGSAMEATSANVGGLPVNDATMNRNGDLMTVDMDMNLAAFQVKGDKEVVITPVIINGNDSIELQRVRLFSRNRWYQLQREGYFNPENLNEGIAFRYSKRPALLDYTESVAYSDWMNGASLKINCDVYSCCHDMVEHDDVTLGRWKEFVAPQPEFVFSFEVASAVKEDSIQGRAYVDFPVNQIIIYPNYRNNSYELGKIIGTIDSVRNDKDITITSIFIKGTASPEGPYDNNIRLAKGRTAALKDYVNGLYKFEPGFIQTDYEPVDWEGLREWLENTLDNKNTVGYDNVPHASEILAIVNSDMEPFARNSKIKSTYPADYKWLLDNVYPALRHSDYTIRYNIRKYTTAEEIAEVLATQPNRLSLDELYVLAESYEPGSAQYNDVLETAVRLFPNNETANINAANAAMSRGDYYMAQKYLDKAGNSSEAEYARGNLLMLQGDYQGAADIFRRVSGQIPQAKDNLQWLIEEEVISE